MVEVIQSETNKVFQASLCTALNFMRQSVNTSFTDYAGIRMYTAWLVDSWFLIGTTHFGTI